MPRLLFLDLSPFIGTERMVAQLMQALEQMERINQHGRQVQKAVKKAGSAYPLIGNTNGTRLYALREVDTSETPADLMRFTRLGNNEYSIH